MFTRIWIFAMAIAKTWGVRVTGGLIIGLIAVWQLTGHSIWPWVGWAVGIGGIVVACFEVWNKQVDLTDQLTKTLQKSDASASLQINIEEAQVFVKIEFLNKKRQIWLQDCSLLVKLHIVNTSSQQCTIQTCRAAYTPSLQPFNVAWDEKVDPLAAEMNVAHKTQVKPLADLRQQIEDTLLSRGDGKSGWLKFPLGTFQASRSSLDRGKLQLKVTDAFGTVHTSSEVDVPYNKSIEVVISENGTPRRSQSIVDS